MPGAAGPRSRAPTRAPSPPVRVGEALEQLLQELAVARCERVERGLLERAATRLVRRLALAAEERSERSSRSSGAGDRPSRPRRLPRVRPRSRRVVDEALRRPPQLLERRQRSVGSCAARARVASRPSATSRRRRSASGAGRPCHRSRAGAGGRGRRPSRTRRAGLEALAPQHPALAVVEDAETGIEPRGKRVRTQQPEAEAVDGRDPGAVELTGELIAAERSEARPDPAAELGRGPLGIGDREHRVDGRPRSRTARTNRSTSTVVLPVPAPAERKTTPGASIAASCSAFGGWFTRAPPGTGRPVAPARTAGVAKRIVTDVARADARRRSGGRAPPSAFDLLPELVLVEVVAPHEPRYLSVLRARCRAGVRAHAARRRGARYRTAEGLDADEVAQHEHVERDLELQLGVDLGPRSASVTPDL